MTILHVLNGDTTAEALARSEVPGARLPFREALVTGPAPAGVEGAEWRAHRAAHLARESGGEPCASARPTPADAWWPASGITWSATAWTSGSAESTCARENRCGAGTPGGAVSCATMRPTLTGAAGRSANQL